MLVAACASREVPRPRPVKILDCPDLNRHISERDSAFRSVRGTAQVRGPDMSFEADIAARTPSDLRVEVAGPLGIKVGLLVMNAERVRFVVPREKTVLQIAKSELDKKSLRAERFLSAIVVPLPPDLLVAAVATQSPLASGARMLACRYLAEENFYEVRLADPKTKGGSILAVDPTTFAPLRWRRYDAFLPELGSEAAARYTYRVDFGDLTGQGLSTIPAKAALFVAPKTAPVSEFKWVRVEVWADPPDSTFDFEHSASFRVKEY